jgi:hypothetical protein
LLADLNYATKQSRAYDCVVPISGGMDSVYTAFYLTQRMGLRCLGVHYDHGMGSENKPKMLDWIERKVGMPIVVHKWQADDSKALVRDSVRSLLGFGPQALQAGFCRHCGYGIRAAVYSEMIHHGLHSVWGKHSFDHIPFRYCTPIPLRRLVFQHRWLDALRALRGRFRQSKALPTPGTSSLKLLFSPMGYPSLPKSNAHLKNLDFFQYIPWNKANMLAELQSNGVEIQPLTSAHSDCRLPPVVDRVLQTAWTVGKKEIYVCNLVRAGQLSTEEGLEQIETIHQSAPDTSCLHELGLREMEIEALFRKL